MQTLLLLLLFLVPGPAEGYLSVPRVGLIASSGRSQKPPCCPALRMQGNYGEGRRFEGYDDDEDIFSSISMEGLSAVSGFLGGPSGFTLKFDGHDASVSQNFRVGTRQVASYIQEMIHDNRREEMRVLLLRYGEDPSEDMSTEDVGDRLIKLVFLSSGLRQVVEDSILGTNTKLDRKGLLEDDDLVDMGDDDTMRPAVSRRTALKPNARGRGKLINQGEDDDDAIQDDEARLLAKTVEQLKAICRARGLKVGGRKAELVARLLEG